MRGLHGQGLPLGLCVGWRLVGRDHLGFEGLLRFKTGLFAHHTCILLQDRLDIQALLLYDGVWRANLLLLVCQNQDFLALFDKL